MICFHFIKKLSGADGNFVFDMEATIDPGAFVGIYGPSGSGKTSLLRMLAGLLKPDSGRFIINDRLLFNSEAKIHVAPQKRNIGLVFQDYALFPSMTVRDNLLFGKKAGRKNRMDELSDVFELGPMLGRKPGNLSGGQQQRVALARALMQEPAILLLDEPLAAADHNLRAKLQQYLLVIHKRYRLTTFLVSHEVGEIFRLCTKVLQVDSGKIIRQGSPSELFMSLEVSGKFQFTGEVLGIEKADTVYMITVLVGQSVVRVIGDEKEVQSLAVGNKVLLASKAFNPIIRKIDN